MNKDVRNKAIKVAVWSSRILFGSVFIISGWAKAIDPWGTFYKLNEYFTAWGIGVNEEIALICSVALAAYEFTLGMCALTGCLRRTTGIFAFVTMALMLPLTIYIAVANPVSDCGCFGDFLVLSNTATMWKNVVLMLAALVLLRYNKCYEPLMRPWLQWLAMTFTCIYALCLCWIGYRVQPPVDFRPYSEETSLCSENIDDDGATMLLYEKEGVIKEFSLEELPDSSWTFIGQKEEVGDNGIAVFDGEDEVSQELFCTDKKMLVLTVLHPDEDYLYMSRYANMLASSALKGSIETIGLVAADNDMLERWKELAIPQFDVYSCEDTSIKELVRGEPGLVLLDSGKVVWKRTLFSVKDKIPEEPTDVLKSGKKTGIENFIEEVEQDNPYKNYLALTTVYLIAMAILLIVSFLPVGKNRKPTVIAEDARENAEKQLKRKKIKK